METIKQRLLDCIENAPNEDSSDRIKRNLTTAENANKIVKAVAIGYSEWINDIGLKKYKEGWCQAGGSNGWHCTSEELYERFDNEILNNK